jgi:hypothetical protein
MRFVRAIFTLLVVASLAMLPARASMITMRGSADTAMTDCASIDDTSCQSDVSMSKMASDTMPMPDGCDQSGNHNSTLPGACWTYCNSLAALPTTEAVTADFTVIETVSFAAVTILHGIGFLPEPHPPKLA